MGVYKAIHSDHVSVRLAHEPVDGSGEVIEIRNPPSWISESVREGKRYLVSLGFTEYVPYVAPVEEPEEVKEDETPKLSAEETEEN